ncbi:uncharacterized protein LOC142251152 isoform X2 [Anomaloglossus baeobatrachus]|uniref:uncharacterized protein LOC142251152 isoform X2 n=1 Tax=Anomaloglossus baeobatrachus TaxID=238106 RepID=UPI003F4F840A
MGSPQDDDGYIPEDDYCKALAWTLYKGKCPMTIGLYVPWGHLRDIKSVSGEKSEFEEKKRPKPSEAVPLHECRCEIEPKKITDENQRLTVKELIKFVFLLVFYDPIFTDIKQEPKSRHNIFIRFSAWHCIGCDHPWAGLVTTLCDDIEDEFGLLPISVYRAVHKKKEIGDEKELEEWVPKKILHIPVWCVTLFVFVILIGALLLKMCLYNFPEYEEYEEPTDYILYMAVAIFGTGSILLSGTILKVLRNFIVTQKDKLMQKMKRTDMSSQLGFMNDVKEEIEIITSYLQIMEMYRKKKIIVIIEITKLDKCLPNRAVEVLHAINVLLSNPDAPFISILAVDPDIIVQCVEKSDLLKGMANNGYVFLNQIITLPFAVTKMNKETKKKHLENIINCTKNKNSENTQLRYRDVENTFVSKNNGHLKISQYIHNGMNTDQRIFIVEALTYLYNDCSAYISDNVINMKRIMSTIITVSMMIKGEKLKSIPPKKMTKWVILAAQWPCSLSWILQCIEDEQQRRSEDEQYNQDEQQTGSNYKQCTKDEQQSGSKYKQCSEDKQQSGSNYKQCSEDKQQTGSNYKQCSEEEQQSGSKYKQCSEEKQQSGSNYKQCSEEEQQSGSNYKQCSEEEQQSGSNYKQCSEEEQQSGSNYKQCSEEEQQSGSKYKQCSEEEQQSGSNYKQCSEEEQQSGSKYKQCSEEEQQSGSKYKQCSEEEQQLGSKYKQCIKDDQQKISRNHDFKKVLLWVIYEMSLETLHANQKSLKQLMDLDRDLDIFYKLLDSEKFRVEDALMLRPYTINLDPTIQRKFELLQSSFNLLRFRSGSMKKMDLLKMSIEAVCEKMKNLKLRNHNDYVKKIHAHNLDGKALLYSENKHIRKALNMNLGDWVKFRAEFLSLPTPNVFF